MPTNIFDFVRTTSSGMSVAHVILNMAITFAIAMFIYWVYRRTYDGIMYSKSFNVTLVMTSLVTAMVMMVIGSNLALSLGMVGALSIIRFRSAIKSPKDIGFLFWGIAAGLSAGTGSYTIAVAGSLMIAIVLFILSRQWGKARYPYLVVIRGSGIDESAVVGAIRRRTDRYNLKMKSIGQDDMEIIYEVSFGKEDQDAILSCLGQLENVKTVNVVSHDGEVAG